MAEQSNQQQQESEQNTGEKLVRFKCKCPNIWTSKGKLVRGESEMVTPEEKQDLEAQQEKIIERIMRKAEQGDEDAE